MYASRTAVARTLSPLLFSTVLVLTSGCSGPKTAPPPAMGDLSGAWLLKTESQPVRFVNSEGDTLTLTKEDFHLLNKLPLAQILLA